MASPCTVTPSQQDGKLDAHLDEVGLAARRDGGGEPQQVATEPDGVSCIVQD